jgi:hypothetical protein
VFQQAARGVWAAKQTLESFKQNTSEFSQERYFFSVESDSLRLMGKSKVVL